MGKEKKEKRKSQNLDDTANSQDSKEVWEQKLKNMNAISKPLASRKLTKKLCKAIKKANGLKQTVKGIREVQKAVRKGGKGLVVFAGDISPIDVYCHMPVTCEPNFKIPPNIQIGNGNKMVIHENGGRKKEKRRKSSSKKCDVNSLTKTEAQLTQDQVDIVAAGLGKDWKTLCRLKLSLTDPEIEQLEHDYQVAGLYEITYQALRRWQQKLGSAATQSKMALYLWEIDRDDLAQQL